MNVPIFPNLVLIKDAVRVSDVLGNYGAGCRKAETLLVIKQLLIWETRFPLAEGLEVENNSRSLTPSQTSSLIFDQLKDGLPDDFLGELFAKYGSYSIGQELNIHSRVSAISVEGMRRQPQEIPKRHLLRQLRYPVQNFADDLLDKGIYPEGDNSSSTFKLL